MRTRPALSVRTRSLGNSLPVTATSRRSAARINSHHADRPRAKRTPVLQVSVLFCSLAVLDPRVGHAMDVLSPFIAVLCHSD